MQTIGTDRDEDPRMRNMLWAVPVLLCAIPTAGCHRHAHIHAGVEYYAPLEPAVDGAAAATQQEKDADAELIEAREREADANQRLAEAEAARAHAEHARIVAEARATEAARVKASANANARAAESARERAEAEARARASEGRHDGSVVIIVDPARSPEKAPSRALPPVAAPSDNWADKN
jgi:hypothetical protein